MKVEFLNASANKSGPSFSDLNAAVAAEHPRVRLVRSSSVPQIQLGEANDLGDLATESGTFGSAGP